MGADDSHGGARAVHGHCAELLPQADGAVDPQDRRTHRHADHAGGRRGWTMNSFAATIPILIVVLSAIAAMLAEAIRHPGERMYVAGFGLIGLVGALVASCFLWDTDAVSFGVVRADNFALFINIVLCIVGIITMVFSH